MAEKVIKLYGVYKKQIAQHQQRKDDSIILLQIYIKSRQDADISISSFIYALNIQQYLPRKWSKKYNSVQILQTYTFLSFPMLQDSNGIFFNPFDPAVQKFKIFIFIFPLLLLLFFLSFMWEVYHFETGYSAPGHFVISFRNPLNPREHY